MTKDHLVNPLLLSVPRMKIRDKSQISFCKILKYEQFHVKVLMKRFHLNAHTMGFDPQTKGRTTLNVSRTDLGSERVKLQPLFSGPEKR